MISEYHYIGPDGERLSALPPGRGAAIGSDYCVHLLPAEDRLKELIPAAAGREAPLLLLAPYFRDAELKRAIGLFRAIPKGADVEVAVNDWGALTAVRALFPWLRLSVGRLLSGQKRCPRIGISTRLTPEGRRWHAEGLFSSERAREYLARAYGVLGYHLDLPPEREERPDDAKATPGAGTPAILWFHVPYAVVTLSDSCPWIGGRSSASVAACPRPCREGAVALREPSMEEDLIQKGKARFVRRAPPGGEGGGRGAAARFVLYDDLP